MSIFFGLVFSIFMATGVLILVRLNGNPNYLTIRGKRVLFFTSIIFGLFLYLIITNLFIDCDIRTGAADGCKIHWGSQL